MKCSDEKYITLHPYDLMRQLNFKEFEKYPTLTDYTLVSVGSDYKIFDVYDKIVYFHFEEPNCFWTPQSEQTIRKNYNKILKLFSPCPYSVNYFNKLYNDDKRQWCFHPFNIKNLPSEFNKKYAVYFTGHYSNNPWIRSMLDSVKKFNHCIVSYDGGTFNDVNYFQKIKLNSESKISIVYNCLYEETNIPMDEIFKGHEAFKNLKKSKLIPQLKTRVVEAAACKSLMLCYFEEFRIVELMFDPDVDFIYWYDLKDLEEKINEILTNYDKYNIIIENAYNKLINNYTTYHFFEKYLRNL